MKKTELKFYHGLSVFAFVIVVVLSVCTPMQVNWGMTGLALTELILLIIAVAPVFISGNALKEVFVFKGVMLRQVAAVAVFWAATICLNALGGAVVMFFWPGYSEQTLEVNNLMTEMFSTIPVWLAFIVVAAMPAVCEEALHRGFIQHTLRGIKNKWLIVLIMGITFGIFHLDPIRFVGTALFGATLAYIMVETGNLAIPMLLHFFNNAVSFVITMLSADMMQSIDAAPDLGDITSFSIGVFIIIGSFAPVLFFLGDTLIHTGEYNAGRKPLRKKALIITASASVLIFIAGFAVLIISAAQMIRSGAFM